MSQSQQVTQFTEDWLCYNTTLGEGAYGEVKLLVHKQSQEKIACKIIDLTKHKEAQSNTNREVTIHKMLHHENVIKYFGRRQESLREYVFLEYASRGELFQLIEPDIGMPSKDAQMYMKQLLNGVSYLHGKGVAHRDIKPENLLICADGTLKISDFGLATLFRLKGKERLLSTKCGTKPYLAPEVLQKPYRAEPSDLWSCAIVFVAMLTGELPWSDTFDSNYEFTKWKKDEYISETPWSKLGNTALSLARQMLNIDPEKRLTIEQVLRHPWMRFEFDAENTDTVDSNGERPAKRFNSMVEAETRQLREIPNVTLSQPAPAIRPSCLDEITKEFKAKSRKDHFFSQPTQNDDLMIQFTQSPVTKDNFHNLVKRMTRFYVNTPFEKTLETIGSVLDAFHFSWNIDRPGNVTISTVDFMKNQLIFKAHIFEMDNKILVDFRLSKGCGLEFKKKFLKIKSNLEHIIDQ